MFSLKRLFRSSHAILFLVFCLQLGLYNAQTAIPKVIEMTVNMPSKVKVNEDVAVTLNVTTELNECMVIKTYLKSNPPQEGSFTYQFTACLCKDQSRRFFWDFQTNENMTIAVVVDIIAEKGICPYDLAVMPITANRFVTYRNLQTY